MKNWQKELENQYGQLQEVYILETNVDDVRGEILGYLIPLLFEKGALDASLISTITKKNRPGHLLHVICLEEKIKSLVDSIISETGTLGIRIRQELRVCLKRKIVKNSVEIKGTTYEYHIKQSFDTNDHLIHSKIEFEDLIMIANKEIIPIPTVEKIILKNKK